LLRAARKHPGGINSSGRANGVFMRACVVVFSISAFMTLGSAVGTRAQETETKGETPSLVMRCETYCSRTKLRTVNARISWADPNVTVGRTTEAAGGPVEQQLETTVFRNGFADGQFATFPTLEPSPDARAASPELPGRPRLRAFDLKIVGSTRPRASGEAAGDIMRLSPEQRMTSVIVEGLEPGLTYYWRVRFRINAGEWRTSEPVMCVAPICPADMREER
jgi:hypothetical protein